MVFVSLREQIHVPSLSRSLLNHQGSSWNQKRLHFGFISVTSTKNNSNLTSEAENYQITLKSPAETSHFIHTVSDMKFCGLALRAKFHNFCICFLKPKFIFGTLFKSVLDNQETLRIICNIFQPALWIFNFQKCIPTLVFTFYYSIMCSTYLVLHSHWIIKAEKTLWVRVRGSSQEGLFWFPFMIFMSECII